MGKHGVVTSRIFAHWMTDWITFSELVVAYAYVKHYATHYIQTFSDMHILLNTASIPTNFFSFLTQKLYHFVRIIIIVFIHKPSSDVIYKLYQCHLTNYQLIDLVIAIP